MICSIIKWYASQMPSTIVVWYSDHHLVNWTVFRPPFEKRFTIQMPNTMVLGIWTPNHLNNKQVEVDNSGVSAIQILTVII